MPRRTPYSIITHSLRPKEPITANNISTNTESASPSANNSTDATPRRGCLSTGTWADLALDCLPDNVEAVGGKLGDFSEE